MIIDAVKAALPLNIEKIPYLRGMLWIQTISNIKIGPEKAEFDVVIRGKNNKIETQLGKRILLMDVGNLNASFNCNASLRYDAPQRLPYITPNILRSSDSKKTENIAETLLKLKNFSLLPQFSARRCLMWIWIL